MADDEAERGPIYSARGGRHTGLVSPFERTRRALSAIQTASHIRRFVLRPQSSTQEHSNESVLVHSRATRELE
jgi:hypothetical protein